MAVLYLELFVSIFFKFCRESTHNIQNVTRLLRFRDHVMDDSWLAHHACVRGLVAHELTSHELTRQLSVSSMPRPSLYIDEWWVRKLDEVEVRLCYM